MDAHPMQATGMPRWQWLVAVLVGKFPVFGIALFRSRREQSSRLRRVDFIRFDQTVFEKFFATPNLTNVMLASSTWTSVMDV
jgi:hypothetical protein